MKKYLIQFMSVDVPALEDDGVSEGTGFGVHPHAFDSKEEAQKYLEETLIPGDKADLESCFGFDDEDSEPDVEIEVEDGSFGRKELTVRDRQDGHEINTTIYDIAEVEF